MIRLPARRVRALAFAALFASAPALGQEGASRMPVPYGVGERLEYDVKFSNLRVGSGPMEVAGIPHLRGRETYHTVFTVRGGNFVYRVNDRYESWIDTRTGNSLRYRQDQHEGNRDVERNFELLPERAVLTQNHQAGAP